MRVFAGAPNEARYGFAQGARAGDFLWISGQVGKDNYTGEVISDPDLEPKLERALANVDDVIAEAGFERDDVIWLQMHVASGEMRGVARALRTARGWVKDSNATATVAAVPDLSHSDYLVEVSALASSRSKRGSVMEPSVFEMQLGAISAVRAGNLIQVGAKHGTGADHGDALANALRQVEAALSSVGGEFDDIVSTLVYVVGPVDSDGFSAICEAHRGAVGAVAPASTLVVVD